MIVLSDKDAKRNLAVNLDRIMRTRKVTQSQLARLTKKPVMTISRACRGQNVPRATVLACVAEALDVSIDRLLGPPPEIPEKTA
jgi:transcriptional regulator with XRE-family HTH domain